MRKILYLSIWALCFISVQGFAQTRYDWHQKRYTVTVQPMQLLRNSLRFDFEMRIDNGPGWLQIGPALYYIPQSDDPDYGYLGNEYHRYYHYREYGEVSMIDPCSGMLGGGLDVNYKWFFDPKRTIYLLGGASYTHFTIRYWGWAWSDYVQDGLLYHEYVSGFRRQHINRFGLNGLFGFQIPSRHAFLVDMFVGFSYRHSMAEKNKPSFSTDVFSYGYTGLVFVTGLRFGIGIK